MSMTDEHIDLAIRAWTKYHKAQREVERLEDVAIGNSNGNKKLAKVLLERTQDYAVACGPRNGFQEQLRTESLMAIMGLLYDIRKLLHDKK